MIEWLLRTIGIGEEFIAHLDQVRLAFGRPLLLVIGLILTVPLGLCIYRRQRNNLPAISRGLHLGLTATRVFILAMLVLVLSKPYLRIDHQIERKPIVALLFDDSQSMRLPAGPFASDREAARLGKVPGMEISAGPDGATSMSPAAIEELAHTSRSSLAQRVVENSTQAVVAPVAEKFDLRYYSFSKQSSPMGVDPETLRFPDLPPSGGPATHLGDAVAKVLDDAAGREVAGILLFSDGQNTGGRTPAEAAHMAAQAPIYTVPIGPATRLSDVALVDVFTSGLVSMGDTARVAVTLQSDGLKNRSINVELRDDQTLVDSKKVQLIGSEQQQIELSFKAEKPGAHYLTVTVPPLPEEPDYLHGNNSDIAYVRVNDDKIRVLYVEGWPRWDFRFLKNAMRRDAGIAGRGKGGPDILVESEPPAELPRSTDELAEYHTIILGDASPKLLNAEFQAHLLEAVRDRGVGLVIAAGPKDMPHHYDESFREMLPVRLADKPGGHLAPVYKPFMISLSAAGTIHESMRLYDDPERNRRIWAQMPPYFWCAAIDRPAPAASVLASNPSIQGRFGPAPLIVHHYFGLGRVLFVGTDSTFRWRRIVGDRFFYKFWGQSIRFAARRDDNGKHKSRIEVRPVCAQPGEQAQIELMAFDQDGNPRLAPILQLRLQGEGAPGHIELSADPTLQGRYVGSFVPPQLGDYRLIYAGGAEPVKAKIHVAFASEELRDPNVNRPVLKTLANATGGKLVELFDLATIPERLSGTPKHRVVHREATVWDNWLTLALLISVYSLDVGLRRLAGLS